MLTRAKGKKMGSGKVDDGKVDDAKHGDIKVEDTDDGGGEETEDEDQNDTKNSSKISLTASKMFFCIFCQGDKPVAERMQPERILSICIGCHAYYKAKIESREIKKEERSTNR